LRRGISYDLAALASGAQHTISLRYTAHSMKSTKTFTLKCYTVQFFIVAILLTTVRNIPQAFRCVWIALSSNPILDGLIATKVTQGPVGAACMGFPLPTTDIAKIAHQYQWEWEWERSLPLAASNMITSMGMRQCQHFIPVEGPTGGTSFRYGFETPLSS